MKITVSEHERTIIILALQTVDTLVTVALANKILAQDPADEGSEITILRRPIHDFMAEHNIEGWEGWDA